jgi:alpha-L-fucosidase
LNIDPSALLIDKEKIMKKIFVLLLFVLFVSNSSAQAAAKPPLPLLPIPTARQMEWQRSELVMFLHFGVNTFTDREWGQGTESPAIFNPVKLDAQQWARAAKNGGFQTLILTAKHHDGFCLWPSRYTNHSVKSSPWRNGQGDVVAELSKACKKFGLKMGLYLSPWDRHEPSYGQGMAYNQHYLGQLYELLTHYGFIHEIWFDGACGEGPNGKKQVYDFPVFWALVRQWQPEAVMFSDAGPDIRWIGNENGHAGETCWSMMDKSRVVIGGGDVAYLNSGDATGTDWIPGECDVSIRKGWFWHPDQKPKSVDELLDIYFKSVGRNGVLLLNIPPNRDGLLDD